MCELRLIAVAQYPYARVREDGELTVRPATSARDVRAMDKPLALENAHQNSRTNDTGAAHTKAMRLSYG
jgi:hypothetical protein